MSVYLAYTGMQNMFLTDQPEFTHFKTIYSRDLKSTSKIVEQPFDQTNYKPGDTLISTFRQNGDYIQDISLKIILPKLTPDGVTSWLWYTNPILGEFVYGFNTSGTQVFTVQLNSRRPSTTSSNWYTVSTGVSLSFSDNKTIFNTSGTISYLVFSSFETARLFGFVNDSIQLFSGFLRFNVNTTSPKSQVTFPECGWLKGDSTLSGLSSYSDDICYKLINSISLYIGKQLIQEFDSNFIKIRKDVDSNYKNRPILKLLEGNTSVVDFDRIYYFDVPFVKIPVYAIPRQDVQVSVLTNPLINLPNLYASLIISFSLFSDTTKLPRKYRIPLTQAQYFQENEVKIRGPMKNIFTNGDINFDFFLNGERFFGKEKTDFDSYKNFTNVPRTSNVAVFDGPINMSRIRDQKWNSSNTSIYAETINILAIENDIAGLLFDYTDVKGGYKKISINAVIPQPTVPLDTFYIFDYIPATASNVVAMYSMRRTNIYYSGPVVRLINGNTAEEDDFYTDSTQSYLRNSSNVNVNTWANGATVYVNKWYDQTGNGNYMYQPGTQAAPALVFANGKYSMYFDNPNTNFTWTKTWLIIKKSIYAQQFTMIMNPLVYSQPAFVSPAYSQMFGSGSFMRVSTTGVIYWSPTTNWKSNNVSSGNASLSLWNTITGVSTSQGGPINVVSDTVDHLAPFTFNGYLFEMGFFNGDSLTSNGEDSLYYARRPSGF